MHPDGHKYGISISVFLMNHFLIQRMKFLNIHERNDQCSILCLIKLIWLKRTGSKLKFTACKRFNESFIFNFILFQEIYVLLFFQSFQQPFQIHRMELI